MTCPACSNTSLPARARIGSCGKCGLEARSLDYLHAVDDDWLCDGCAMLTGHFEVKG